MLNLQRANFSFKSFFDVYFAWRVILKIDQKHYNLTTSVTALKKLQGILAPWMQNITECGMNWLLYGSVFFNEPTESLMFV